MKFTLFEHIKQDGRKLWLYSQGPKSYEITNDLPPVENPSQPIRRFHPLRGEPVYYNPGRNNRSLNPPPEYNPLAAVQKDGFPGEIPVTDFEVAIFPNRWPGLSYAAPELDGAEPAYGRCEVVVYSPNPEGSVADLDVAQTQLLIAAVGDRVTKILADDNKINFVLPFENRGAFVGTSLPHPHGQIYAFGDLPPIIERQMKNAKATGFFADIEAAISPDHVIAENDTARLITPPFARYPFEVWLLPKVNVSNPSEFDVATSKGFAELLRTQVKIYDTMFSTRVPYAMWHACPARGYEGDWPYHIQFWPLQRGEGKMKYLASVEQIANLFLMDVLPEDVAAQMRDHLATLS